MPPRLVIVAGPSRGTQVALEAEDVVLGRDSACGVCLPDATLSRRHAALARTPEGWRLRDLGSLNGLRVNGLSTADHLLVPGDRIELGSSVLVYRPELPEAGDGPAEGLPEPEVLSTIRLPLSQALFAGDAAASASRKTERSLGLLLAAGRRFATERTEEGLARALLAAACDAVGGSAGAVLLADEGNGLREAAVLAGSPGVAANSLRGRRGGPRAPGGGRPSPRRAPCRGGADPAGRGGSGRPLSRSGATPRSPRTTSSSSSASAPPRELRSLS